MNDEISTRIINGYWYIKQDNTDLCSIIKQSCNNMDKRKNLTNWRKPKCKHQHYDDGTYKENNPERLSGEHKL